MKPADLNEAWVFSAAPSAESAKACRALAVRLAPVCISRDGETLFAECPGSSEKTYTVSVDFKSPSPACRCSCPSRRTPCKHALALMLRYVRSPGDFVFAELPMSAEKAPRKPRPNSEASRQRAAAARAAKKAAAQAAGIDAAMSMAEQLLNEGLGSLTPQKTFRLREKCRALADSHLPGVCSELLSIMRDLPLGFGALSLFYARCGRAKEYFGKKTQDPSVFDAELESFCGRAWKLAELAELGGFLENARLIQLYFESTDNEVTRAREETGYWISLDSGEIYVTQNLRPYHALGRTRQERPCHSVLNARRLYHYPSGNRVRWDSYTLSQPSEEDYAALLSFAESSVPRGRFASLLAAKAFFADDNGNAWLSCADGGYIELTAKPRPQERHKAVFTLLSVNAGNRIVGRPLALAAEDGITRL